jgi:protocatechuate 3,4-dioxygenase beta subunit
MSHEPAIDVAPNQIGLRGVQHWLEGLVRVMPLVLLALVTAVHQQAAPPPPPPPAVAQPPRDTPPRTEPKGTAVIRGRVVAADTGLPIRQANVNLTWMQAITIGANVSGGVVSGTVEFVNGGAVSVVTSTALSQGRGRGPSASTFIHPRSTRTDDQGNFEFKALPAGTYRLSASTSQYSAQYLAFGYGAKRTISDPGTPITLSEGQTFDKATIALPRGAVIVGRITDDGGEPMARVQVYGLWFPPGSTRGQRNSGGVQTDDLGQFRLFGLQPGEYAVVAEARMPTFVNPNVPQSDAEEERSGFLTTFYPGTPDEAAAQHVRTRAGVETTGIEIRMSKGRLFRISGIVMDSQGNPMAHAIGQLFQLARRTSAVGMFGTGFSTDEQGRFQMQNLAPGNYRVIVRQRPQNVGPNGPEANQGEMANVPVTLAGADLENLMIVTRPGVTVLGHVEFEQGPPQQPIGTMRITTIPGDQEFGMLGAPPNATVRKDLTFKLAGLNGEYLIRGGGGLPQDYYIKAVLVGGDDVSDTPREFKPQDHVTLLISSRGATLEGTVTDAKGTPTSDAGIIVFPEDKASWRATSTRVRRSSPDAQGHYRISQMHPGRYFILATERGRLNTFPGLDYAAFYDELSKEATTLIVNEDETRMVDLKVVASSGGH